MGRRPTAQSPIVLPLTLGRSLDKLRTASMTLCNGRPRTNVYDNVMEYWVCVREHGAYEEEHEIQEKKRSLSKAS